MLNVMEERDIQAWLHPAAAAGRAGGGQCGTRRTTPIAGGSSPRSRIASAPRSAPTTRVNSMPRWAHHPGGAPDGSVPAYLIQILARFTCYLRESHSVDQRSGVSARFAIAAAETVAASARHRGAVLGENDPVARIVDLGTVIDVLRGKLEFESGRRPRAGRPGTSVASGHGGYRAATVGGIDVGPLVAAVEGGSAVTTGELVAAKDVLAALPGLPVIDAVANRLEAESDGERAGALEPALEALYLAKRDRQGDREGETVLASRGSRYSAYTGGPDPLAPPVDLRDALERIGDDVMAGVSPRRAPRGAFSARRPEHARR